MGSLNQWLSQCPSQGRGLRYLLEMQHLRPHPGPLSQNLEGVSYPSFHMPPLKCGDLCFLSSQLRLVV